MGEDKRSNEGYEIIESCTVGSTEFVIGHHLTAANPYVCWHCKNGTDYFWGYYTNELSLAQDKCVNATKMQLVTSLTPNKSHLKTTMS